MRIIKRFVYLVRLLIVKIKYPKKVFFEKNIAKINLPSVNDLDAKSGRINFRGSATILEYSKIGVRNNGTITFGENFFANKNFTCICYSGVEIKNDVSIGPNVCIYDHDHKFNKNGKIKNEYTFGKITIGNNVWIGAGAIILKNTKIGDNCIIGAGTIVKGEIPANSLVYNNRNQVIVDLIDK